MGGTVSAGQTNDELIDNLVEADCIKTALVEKVFRGVDRANYYLPDHRDSAYKDLAWKNGNIHLSAPCIYAEVMEALKLQGGQKFLNLGSGTGYLSTLAGLVLGSYGVNHGVEFHEDVIEYAKERLEEFKKTADAFDEYDFCEPVFSNGNCLLIHSGCTLYDRVYCGASCPHDHENYMKNLIKVDGILVMPLEDHLLQITRTGETEWETKSVLPVSFAPLIPYNEKDINHIHLPDLKVMTLQETIRVTIRALLRANIRIEHPSMGRAKRSPKRPKRPRIEKRRRINILPSNLGMMLLGSLNDSESDEDAGVHQSEASSRESEGSNEALSSSSHSSRSSDDPGADYILQQMMAMQRHFMDMSRTERLQEQEDDDEDDDDGIDVREPEDGAVRKRPRTRRALLENGTASTDSEAGMEDPVRAQADALPTEDPDEQKPEEFGFRKPLVHKRCTLSASSGDDVEADGQIQPTNTVSSAIPITQATAERRRYSSSASMSTSATSGFGTCSSVEEPTDMEGISKDLETHTEEPALSETEGRDLCAMEHKIESEAGVSSEPQAPNGAKNASSKSNGKSEETVHDLAESVLPLLCDTDQSATASKRAAKAKKSNGFSARSFSKSPPKVSIKSASPLLEEEERHESDDDLSDVDMTRIEECSGGTPGEVTEEADISADSGITFRQYMQEKVELLPIPGALKQYLLHYRT